MVLAWQPAAFVDDNCPRGAHILRPSGAPGEHTLPSPRPIRSHTRGARDEGTMLRSLPKMFREPSAVHPEHDTCHDDETRPENREPLHHDGPRPSVNLRRSGTTVVRAQQRNELIDAIVAAFVAPSAPHADVARAFGELRKVLWRSVIEWKTRVDPISHQQARAVRGYAAPQSMSVPRRSAPLRVSCRACRAARRLVVLSGREGAFDACTPASLPRRATTDAPPSLTTPPL